MSRRRPRLTGPAAVSAVALASLIGASGASAQEDCLECPPPTFGPPGLNNAFLKLAERGFPGNTDQAMLKWGGRNAFLKLAAKGFPGNTENVFLKFTPGE